MMHDQTLHSKQFERMQEHVLNFHNKKTFHQTFHFDRISAKLSKLDISSEIEDFSKSAFCLVIISLTNVKPKD